MAIDVHKAIEIAKAYLTSIYVDPPLQDLRVEEIEHTDNGNWLITLGYRAPGVVFINIPGARPARDLKVIAIDSLSGEVLAMRNRAA